MTQSSYIVEVTQQNFHQVVVEGSMQQPVLVDFWADWCQPCKVLMPILEKLAHEYRGGFVLAKINTDVEQAIAGHFNVRSLPTVMLIKQGQVVDQFTGAQPESAIRAFLERHIERPGASLREQAQEAEAEGRLADALQLYQQALLEAPTEKKLIIDLARVLAKQGDAAQAEQLLDQLPADLRAEPEAKALLALLGFVRQVPQLPPVAALEQRLAANAQDSEAAYQLAVHALAGTDYQRAIELLFALMQSDRAYGDDLARKTLLEVFELLGKDHPLAREYRRRLFASLY